MSRDPHPLSLPLSSHAWSRMCGRRIPADVVSAVLEHGRIVHVPGATVHVVGHREARSMRARGVDLGRAEGVHVVCAPDGTVLTVYRNQDLRHLRPHARARR